MYLFLFYTVWELFNFLVIDCNSLDADLDKKKKTKKWKVEIFFFFFWLTRESGIHFS